MKRKIFSTLLFGALAFVSLSTVTSCKDYDDDINNLQGQIDKMALKTDVDALRSQLEATKSTAESALAKATANESEIAKVKATAEQAGKDVADAVKAAAEAKSSAADAAAAAKKAQETADAAVKAAADNSKTLEEIGKWQATVVTTDVLAKEMEDLLTKINEATEEQVKELTKIVKAFDGSINALYSAVTEVSLVGSFSANDSKYSTNFDLSVEAGKMARTFEFGKEELDDKDGKHSATPTKKYTENTPFGFTDDFLIRVNPVNAIVTKDMIKFIDSKGDDLNELFEIVNVAKYDDLLTRGSGNATGLWVVTAKPKKNVDDTNDGVTKDGKQKLYAVAINNTADQAEAVEDAANRYVVSTYDLTFNATAWTAPANLHPVKVYSETTMGKDNAKVLNEIRVRDNNTCSGAPYIIPAKSGENIVVDFSGLADKAEWFYVVRDDKHAGESDASEINAWNTYQYEGLNQVYAAKDGGKIKVTIPASVQAGDEIAFRVFAVDYAGNLINSGDGTNVTTGHSFMVYVAAENATATVTGDILATAPNKAETGWLALTGSLSDGNNVTNISGGLSNVTLKVSDNESWNVKVTFAKDANGTPATKNSEIKYAKFESTDAMTAWTDGATASTAIEIKDTYRQTIAGILNISLTKKLPDLAYTLANHKYSWKGEQIVNGVFTAYLFTNTDGKSWNRTAATTGYKELADVLNGFQGTQYEYVVENAVKVAKDGKDYFTGAKTTKGTSSIMDVDNTKDANNVLLIDNATEHASRIQYNYGLLSSIKVNNAFVDYCIVTEEFKTVFACPLNTTAQTYSWKQWSQTTNGVTTTKDVNVLTWGSDATVEDVEIGDYIVGKNSFDNSKFGGVFNNVGTTNGCCMLYPNNWGTADGQNKAELLTNSNGKPDYFDVTYTNGKLVFKHTTTAANPTADVPSTLKLTLYDAFGHENVYELPFTVKRAQ